MPSSAFLESPTKAEQTWIFGNLITNRTNQNEAHHKTTKRQLSRNCYKILEINVSERHQKVCSIYFKNK